MRLPVYICVVLVTALAASCMTVNELDTVDLYGSRMAVRKAVPPEPEVDVSFDLRFDPENPVATAVSIGANLAKASIATKATATMREALESVELPERVMEESFARAADVLGAIRVYTPGHAAKDAEFLFDMEIRSYGIEADSPSGAVSFNLSALVAIREMSDGDLLWRRSINVDLEAHPGMFGLPSEVGSAISAAALANLTAEQMRAGFERLVDEASVEIGRKLERDLYRAKYR